MLSYDGSDLQYMTSKSWSLSALFLPELTLAVLDGKKLRPFPITWSHGVGDTIPHILTDPVCEQNLGVGEKGCGGGSMNMSLPGEERHQRLPQSYGSFSGKEMRLCGQ